MHGPFNLGARRKLFGERFGDERVSQQRAQCQTARFALSGKQRTPDGKQYDYAQKAEDELDEEQRILADDGRCFHRRSLPQRS